MRERVAMLEGELTAGPTESGGFEVAVWIPVPAEPEAERVPEKAPEAGRPAAERTSRQGPGAGAGREQGTGPAQGVEAGPGGTRTPPPPPAARPTSAPGAWDGAGDRAAAPTLSFRKDSAPREGSG